MLNQLGRGVACALLFALTAPAASAAEVGGRTMLVSAPVHQSITSAGTSQDGAVAVFVSNSSAFTPGDGNGLEDAFAHQTATGYTARISVAIDGGDPNGRSTESVISHDGRVALFTSEASNLVPGDTNGKRDVFARLLCLSGKPGCRPVTRLVSSDASGEPADGHSEQAVISPNGQYIAFVSAAEDLTAPPAGGRPATNVRDVFVRELLPGDALTLGPTVQVSVSGVQQGGNGHSDEPAITRRFFSARALNPPIRDASWFDRGENGLFVAFSSEAVNLAEFDYNGYRDVYVRKVCMPGESACTPRTERLSVTHDFQQAEGGDSRDPTFGDLAIAYESDATNLADEGRRICSFPCLPPDMINGQFEMPICGFHCDNNNVTDIFTAYVGPIDIAGGAAFHVTRSEVDPPLGPSLGTSGAAVASQKILEPDGASYDPFFDRNHLGTGTLLSFVSEATNLDRTDTNLLPDIYVRSGPPDGDLFRVTRARDGAPPNGGSRAPVMAGGRLAFVSDASDLVAGDLNGAPDAFVLRGPIDDPSGIGRVSVASSGATEADADAAGASIDASRTLVAFASAATNLTPGASGGWSQIYVRNTARFTTTRVSVDPNGFAGSGNSTDPEISADGRYVVFTSDAPDLIDGFTPNCPAGVDPCTNVYARDLVLDRTSLVSSTPGGEAGGGASRHPTVFSDQPRPASPAYTSVAPPLDAANRATLPGSWVAFASKATDLVTCPEPSAILPRTECDTNGSEDVFLRDLATGTTTRISTDAEGDQAVGDSNEPSLAVGATLRVAFTSAASLTADGYSDRNGTTDIFVKDINCLKRAECVATRLFRASDAAIAPAQASANGPSRQPTISPDGNAVAFTSAASNLVRGLDTDADGDCDAGCDRNGAEDVFVHDLTDRVTVRASSGPWGDAGAGASSAPSLASRYHVAFVSEAPDLTSQPDTNDAADVFVRSLRDSVTLRASTSRDGAQGSAASAEPAELLVGSTISLVFTTRAPEIADVVRDAEGRCLGGCDEGTDVDVIVLEAGGARLRASVPTQEASTAGMASGSSRGRPSVSTRYGANGDAIHSIAFTTEADDLLPEDPTATSDVIVATLTCVASGSCERRLQLASRSAAGAPGNDASFQPSISADGRSVAFASLATNLGTDNISTQDIFIRRLDSQRVDLVSGQNDGDSQTPSISDDGRWVAFASIADDIDVAERAGRSNSTYDVFVRECPPQGAGCSPTAIRVSDPVGTSQVANGASSMPSISADGTRVAFLSTAPLTGVTTEVRRAQAFVWDRDLGITRVSEIFPGIGANASVTTVAISPDGTWVAFTTAAANLGSASGGTPQVYRAPVCFAPDPCQLRPEIVSVDPVGAPGGALPTQPVAISDRGAAVAFVSTGALTPGDTPGAFADVFVRTFTGTSATTERISVGDLEAVGADAGSYGPAMDAAGAVVAFYTTATNLLLPQFDDNRSCDNDGDERPRENCTDVYVRLRLRPSPLVT